MEFPRHEEQMKALQDMTDNVYTDLEAIESRLDDRIDGIEKRSDEAIKSLAKVLAEELGTFCRKEIHEQISGHAADWFATQVEYRKSLRTLSERLDSARERGTGGVQDCMKLLSELRADALQRSVNMTKSIDLTDEVVEELKRRVEKLEQGKIDSVSPALHGGIPARLGKPRSLTGRTLADDRIYAEAASTKTDSTALYTDAQTLKRIREASRMTDWDRQMLLDIERRLRNASDDLRP